MLTDVQRKALVLVIRAIEDTVRECPGANGGIIATALMRVGIQPTTTQEILNVMVQAGKLRVSNHQYYVKE